MIPEDRMHYILDNMNLVHYVVRKFHPSVDDYEDLVQEGMFGLCLSAIRFKEGFGTFSTYAVPYISGYIQRYLRENKLIKYSRSFKDMLYRINKYIGEYPEASQEEICAALKISSYEYIQCIILSEYDSLDRLIEGKDDHSVSIGDFIPDTSVFDKYFDDKVEEILIEIENDVVKDLPKKHRDIYDDYFYSNLFGEDITQNELAKKYDVSQSYASRIICKINKDILQRYKKETEV